VLVRGRCPRRAVEVLELPDNPGLPVGVTFDAVARRVRAVLSCPHEPVWVETWPARAVTAVLLERPTVPMRHELRRTPTGWLRLPLRLKDFEQLMREARQEEGRSCCSSQPW